MEAAQDPLERAQMAVVLLTKAAVEEEVLMAGLPELPADRPLEELVAMESEAQAGGRVALPDLQVLREVAVVAAVRRTMRLVQEVQAVRIRLLILLMEAAAAAAGREMLQRELERSEAVVAYMAVAGVVLLMIAEERVAMARKASSS